jgi:long-chain acyl-CoA synthetase
MNGTQASSLEFVCGGSRLDGASLMERARRVAAGLRGLGLHEGDVVAVMLPNVPQYADVILAARLSGIAYCPINWHFKTQEVAYLLADSRSRVLIVDAKFFDAVREAIPSGTKLLIVGGSLCLPHPDYDEWLQSQPAEDGPPAAPRGAMPYTSGTTGRPKGIVRLPVAPADRERQAALLKSLVGKAFGVRPGCRALLSAPAYHSAPGVFLQNALLHASLIVVSERFDAEQFLADVERHRIDTAYLVPLMFVRLLRLPQAVRERYDISSLRFVTSTGAPCPADVKRRMIEWFGPVIYESYGSSETGMVTVVDSRDALARPGSVGLPIDEAAIRILDEEGRPRRPGETGLVYVRQPAFPDFTYRGDDAARRRIERDGHLCLGDVGYLDEDGYLYLCDRASDMVISGGVNIYPAEIEACLIGHDGVADCAVFGVPDEEYGERLVAVVEPGCGAQPGRSELEAWLRARLASFKVPREMIFCALPRDDSGKIVKRRLREQYTQGVLARGH